jgi:hypothetical protein
MTHLSNAFAWQIGAKWYYAEGGDAAAHIAVEVERYDSDGNVVFVLAPSRQWGADL